MPVPAGPPSVDVNDSEEEDAMTSTAPRDGTAEATAGLITFRVSVTSTATAERLFAALTDLPAHLEWAGRRSAYKTFALLELDDPGIPLAVGTTFSSVGASPNGTFHDSSVVTEVEPSRRLAFVTDARLDRKHGAEWRMHFLHRYDVEPQPSGCRVDYSCTATHRTNYVPYWLRPWMRPLTRAMVSHQMRVQLGNLVALAEGR